MGRGGYTVSKFLNNLAVDHDAFGADIIDDVVTHCEVATSELDRCSRSLRAEQPPYILVDLGVNDVGFIPPWSLPNQTTWQNNYIAILDALHAQWPDAVIYLTKPWKRQAGGNEALFDTMAGWVENVVAARSSFTRVGDDERSWFGGNPSTFSDDGIHWNAAGQIEKANQMKAVLGY